MKKIIISLIICVITFGIIFLIIDSKENKKDENNNISIILETEEGNIETNTFPSKENYEYSKVVCENTNNNIEPTFNTNTWKLNISVEEEKIDGNFNCIIYFKEKTKLANEIIISKYKENNTEGLIKIDQPKTEQTLELTEYRYSGSNNEVKNYVNFNDELWRIIGVFPTEDASGNIENRVKIIREESIGAYSWDTSATSINSGNGINQWGESGSYSGADLMRLLNPGYESESVNNSLYWNRKSGKCYNDRNNVSISCDFTSFGLTEESRNMIDTVKWYTSVVAYFDKLAGGTYLMERGTEVGTKDVGISVTKTISWIGKVALPYASDYAYSSKSCYENVVLNNRDTGTTSDDYRSEECVNSSWFPKTYIRMISPFINTSNEALSKHSWGMVTSHYCVFLPNVYPTLYLKPVTKIISGDGSKLNPFELSIN